MTLFSPRNGLVAGAVAAALVLSGSVAANAVEPEMDAVPAVNPISADAQAADARVVSTFLAANPVPVNAPGSSESTYAAYKAAVAQYWKNVPWGAIYGQWGCSVDSIDQTKTPDGAVPAPVLTVMSTCHGNIVADRFAGTLKPRTVVEQSPEYEAFTIAVKNGPAERAGVLVNDGKCAPSNPFSLCIGADYPGDIHALTRNNDFNTWALSVRLGSVTPGTCSLGNYIASSGALRDVPAGSSIVARSTTNVNGNWSNATTTKLTSTPVIRCATA